jgi:dihydrofolate reductase
MPAARPRLCLIAAMAQGRVIGRDNALPWHLPEDLKHFRRVTLGAPVLMGRRTWESLPARFRPLPGRTNVVLTRQVGWQTGAPGVLVVESLDAALAAVTELQPAPAQVFVIGGAELYAQALPRADELVITEIDAAFEGDAWLPAWPADAFAEVAREIHQAAEPNHFEFCFVRYQRRAPG